MGQFEAVIVGGGVIGLAVAWRAALEGLSVAVVDDGRSAAATPAAAGMLAPVAEVSYGEEALLALNLEAAARYPEFVSQLEAFSGMPAGYRRTGTLIVARDLDDNRRLSELHDFQRRLGLDVHRLTSRECRSREPALAPSIRGGIWVEGDHSVDNRALAAALITACDRAGVTSIRARATEISPAGVSTSRDELIGADAIVLAAGCWSASIPGVPEAALPPVRPVRGQLLHLAAPDGSLLFATVRGLDVYLVPRSDGRLIVGATVEEAGFDYRVTAGAVFELLRAAIELVPGIAELQLTESVSGLRPGSPDNAPVIGATSLPWLFVATGHYRNGILLAPVTADALAQMLIGKDAPELIEPFSPLRFSR